MAGFQSGRIPRSRCQPGYKTAKPVGRVRKRDGSEPAGGGFRAQRPAGSFGNRFAPADGGEGSPRPTGSFAGQKPPQRAEGEAANAANAANAARPGEWEPGQTTPSSGDSSLAADSESDPGKAHCLAETRGRDWGLPDAARGSVPITRPIRIDLDATRVVLVPERGLGSEKQIELQGDTTDTIDDLVSAVWGHMESWGIAGRGMYWRRS